MSDPNTSRPKPRRARGLMDRRGPALATERELIARIARVYEQWGFEPLETPALEYADALGKFLPDEDRPNEGVFAIQDDDEQWLALRYDLTVPLARVVANYRNELPRFFKRYQIQPVWRADRPARGRYREFYQCDVDAIGSSSMIVEAELIANEKVCATCRGTFVAVKEGHPAFHRW